MNRKVFESEEYYGRLKGRHNPARFGGNGGVPIKSIERDKLLVIFPMMRKPYGGTISNQLNLHNESKIIYVSEVITIFVAEDEWYYVRINSKFIQSNDGFVKSNMFKCDQFEGVVECIRNEVLGVKN